MSAIDELYTDIEWTGVKIKECPFCGSAGQLYQYKAGPNVYQKVVMCTNGGGDDENGECPMYMPPDGFYKATKKEAIAAWNNRANSEEQVKVINYRKAIEVLAYTGVFRDAPALIADIESGKFDDEYEIVKANAIGVPHERD